MTYIIMHFLFFFFKQRVYKPRKRTTRRRFNKFGTMSLFFHFFLFCFYITHRLNFFLLTFFLLKYLLYIYIYILYFFLTDSMGYTRVTLCITFAVSTDFSKIDVLYSRLNVSRWYDLHLRPRESQLTRRNGFYWRTKNYIYTHGLYCTVR